MFFNKYKNMTFEKMLGEFNKNSELLNNSDLFKLLINKGINDYGSINEIILKNDLKYEIMLKLINNFFNGSEIRNVIKNPKVFNKITKLESSLITLLVDRIIYFDLCDCFFTITDINKNYDFDDYYIDDFSLYLIAYNSSSTRAFNNEFVIKRGLLEKIIIDRVDNFYYEDDILSLSIKNNISVLDKNKLKKINIDNLIEDESFSTLIVLINNKIISEEQINECFNTILNSNLESLMKIDLKNIKNDLSKKIIEKIYNLMELSDFISYIKKQDNYYMAYSYRIITKEDDFLELIKNDVYMDKTSITYMNNIFYKSDDISKIYNYLYYMEDKLSINGVDKLCLRIMTFEQSNISIIFNILINLKNYSSDIKNKMIKIIKQSKNKKYIIDLIIYVDINYALEYFNGKNLNESLKNMLIYLSSKENYEKEISEIIKYMYKDKNDKEITEFFEERLMKKDNTEKVKTLIKKDKILEKNNVINA